MVKQTSSKDPLLAVTVPRGRRAAALMDYVIYERGLELGAVSPDPKPADAKALYTLIVQAMTSDTGHKNLRPVIPPELTLPVDTQALAHAMRTTALHFKTEQPLAVTLTVSGGRVRIQCKSPAPKAIEEGESLRAKLEKSIAILGAELDLDPLTPSSMSILLPLPKRTRAARKR